MAKQFLTKKEKEKILETYSRCFEREFDKIGPYTFGIPYTYMISMCPEIYKGTETGRILVNHFKYISKIPFFIDVWERVDGELYFSSRNLSDKNLVSASERIKMLEEELEAYQRMNESKAEVLSLRGRKLSEYVRKEYKYWKLSHEEMNRAFNLVHAMKEEQDTYFKESTYYWELLKERDDALMTADELKSKNFKLEETVKKLNEKLLSVSKSLKEAPKNEKQTHNARGAGRKKSKVTEEKRKKVQKMILNGVPRDEICKEMGIGKSTYYRYAEGVVKGN